MQEAGLKKTLGHFPLSWGAERDSAHVCSDHFVNRGFVYVIFQIICVNKSFL